MPNIIPEKIKRIDFVSIIMDRIQGKAPPGSRRSPDWPEARDSYLEENNRCFVCGSKKNLEVHHIIPFHIAPDLELNKNNFIVLCESRKYKALICHLLIGHLGNYRRFNFSVVEDALEWHHKLVGYKE